MKALPLPRKTANLSEAIHQQLSMYALAASAAGVGTLCFAKPAEARIVYTPAHVAIKANGGFFAIDLDHDGSPDFGLYNRWDHSTYASNRTLAVRPSHSAQPANGIWMTNSKACGGTAWGAAALPKGKRIGPKGEFKHSYGFAVMAAHSNATTCGVWANQSNLQAYLGLKFTIQGKIHFGWARVKVDTDLQQRPYLAILTGYAYETIPGKAIIAGATKGPEDAEPTAAFSSHTPEPATLSALALGAPGLSIWRRKESAAAALAAN